MSGDATIGDLIAERYRLERVLGRGGMATVFVATDEKLNRNVAIKLLHTDLARQPNFRTRFRQEAQAAARLNHPNVVRVFDAGESADPTDPNRFSPFLVMELVDGHTLADLLHSGPIAHTEAVRIARELLSALEFAHASGIVHRDIKPGNIMVTPTGGVKVLDFGIARSVESLAEAATAPALAATPASTALAATAVG
ncbi:MAG: protein kinase domain-containing protein, partial [Agromyces sp.]